VELKVSQLNSVQSVGISWWTSSSVLCGTLIVGIWKYGLELGANPLFPALRNAINFFFLSIVLFGILMVAHCAYEAFALSALKADDAKAFVWDFAVTSISYLMATTTFILVTMVWFKLSN
jgi:hypothetical protein